VSLATRRAPDRTPLVRSRGARFESVVGAAAGWTLIGAAAALAVTALVDITGEGEDALGFTVVGAIGAIVGFGLLRVFRRPVHAHRRGVITSLVTTMTSLIALSAVAYWAVGAFDRPDDALFESVAGFSTTSLTVLNPLEGATRGVLFWRATSQWLGGGMAMFFAVAVLPFFGASDLGYAHGQNSRADAVAPRVWVGIQRLAKLYVGLTAVIDLAYLIAGMGTFDAITFSFTTASTGGFANYTDSLAHFDSAAIEWVAIGGMAVAGTSMALIWWVIRGAPGSILRSMEFRLYAFLLVGATATVSVWTWDTGSAHEVIRQAAFTITASLSTTGFRVVDWGMWIWGAQVMILALIGIGSMSGSLGGGFRTLRAIEATRFVGRELRRQLHPHARQVIKINDTVVSEETLWRMHAFQLLYIAVAAGGAFALALLDVDLITAISGSISSLATMGPALGELAGFADATVLDAPSRGVLMVVMFLGRLAIYPVVLAVGLLWISTRRGLRR
jgi:trk system potassium uptake protein TrkH